MPFPLVTKIQFIENPKQKCFILIDEVASDASDFFEILAENSDAMLISALGTEQTLDLIEQLNHKGISNVLILMNMAGPSTLEELIIESALYPGSLLIDGIGQGVCLQANNIPAKDLIRIGYGLLQATRARITQTEYIACPSCGRTLFNIQQRLQEVKKATSGLKGLKIAVMGCIVNGPGEMADADYGYVGSGNGMVTLYKSGTISKQSIPESMAVDALVDLIKTNGDWNLS